MNLTMILNFVISTAKWEKKAYNIDNFVLSCTLWLKLLRGLDKAYVISKASKEDLNKLGPSY